MRRFYRNPDNIAGQIPEAEKLAYLAQVIREQLPPDSKPNPRFNITLMEAIQKKFKGRMDYDKFVNGLSRSLIPKLNGRINEVAAKVEQLAKEFAIEQAQEQYGVDISGEL
jgi:hypothetical protein